MRKIFTFEIDMAIKDRPKLFRWITLVLFSFSITVIMISSFSRLLPSATAASNKEKQKVPAVYQLTPTKDLMYVNK